jgi:hypothetical protein
MRSAHVADAAKALSELVARDGGGPLTAAHPHIVEGRRGAGAIHPPLTALH